MLALLSLLLSTALAATTNCPHFEQWARHRHEPFSPGRYNFPFQRPPEACRTTSVAEVEGIIAEDMREAIADPDLYRLFENAWPNTLDTTVLWQGRAAHNPDEELAFVTTGDIHAMWLRDSANQLQSYRALLDSSPAIAALFRGAINLQARYIRAAPYCNAFHPPPEARNHPKLRPRWEELQLLEKRDAVKPEYDRRVVFECKYELDSLAAFLQLSWDYFAGTSDAAFFGRFAWPSAVHTIMGVARAMQQGTYGPDGRVLPSPYTWRRQADSATENVPNHGRGAPVRGGIGLVRSFFRPSDDACTLQYLVPANMMLAQYLNKCARIMRPLNGSLADEMEALAGDIEIGINGHAIVTHPVYGDMYAYEVDGFGSYNLMDDANLPSLLGMPLMGYMPTSPYLYLNTRAFALSPSNPYYARGSVLNATGGPHLGPGMAWPMGLIVQLLTSTDEDEIVGGIAQLLGSTDGLGLIHESVDSHDAHHWTRSWFAWANGLFGQLVLELAERMPGVLARSYQDDLGVMSI